MEDNIAIIKNWLGSGSINIFGLPLSGKDTVGIKLAEALGGKYLSSGVILRAAEPTNQAVRDNLAIGLWAPTDQFYDLVLPYFDREDLNGLPLTLGAIGRWSGEEQTIINYAKSAGHEIKAAILLNISEADIHARWEQLHILQDRGTRTDDKDVKALNNRVNEFKTKTMPVIQTYRDLGILIPVNADQSREAVYTEVVQKLADFALNTPVEQS
ncbi:nucleoside monophosphate kinase [Candidatus Saccharibacteria bacterium]|nr:nucleoside monophosphate kinase [Candidatus Saccharibacteria bacterium]